MNFVAVARAIDELASLLTGEPLDPAEDSSADVGADHNTSSGTSSGTSSAALPAEQSRMMTQMVETLNKTAKNTDPDLLPLDLTNDVLEDLEALDDLLEHAFHARPIERMKLLKTMLEIIQDIEAALLALNDDDGG